MNPADRVAAIRAVLDGVFGVDLPWVVELDSTGQDAWVSFPNPHRSAISNLEVHLRADGDLDVRVHVPERAGSPFEAHFLLPPGEDNDAFPEIGSFIDRLIHEHLILVYKAGLLTGGREFLSPSELENTGGRRIEWVASWKGTYDQRSDPA